MADSRTRDGSDEATIEREVRRTQDEIGDTVEKLEQKLSPRGLMGEDGADAAEEALQVARQNPIPVALIAIGVIWLLATSRSPTIARLKDRITGKRGSGDLRPRSEEPAPIGPPPATGEAFDRRGAGDMRL